MSEQQSARYMLDQAEHAATAGDLASADEFLRSAARIQEAELGPHHPDLANTLNNLAIVAERTGRPSEAETLYRRAAAIAAAALPPDHPMVAESRQNLEDFCRARGLSIDAPAVIAPIKAVPPPSTAPPAEPRSRTTPAAQPPPPSAASAGASHSLAWVATGAVVLIAVIFLVLRPWSSHDAPAPAAPPEPAAAQPADAAPPIGAPPIAAPPIDAPPIAAPPVTPAPTERTAPPKAASPGDITVATGQLCRVFSTSGSSWRCDPAGDATAPGPIVFYTRVRSPQDAAVEHRWYRGGALRQSVRLRIQANATDGYRTYSRQRVDDGDWRVEVRSADGRLLLEQRFAVR